MKYLISGQEMPLELFDNAEAWRIEEIDGFCTIIWPHEWQQNPKAEYYWSVYLHYDGNHPLNNGFAGAEWIADVPTEEAAEALRIGLLKSVEAAREAENV